MATAMVFNTTNTPFNVPYQIPNGMDTVSHNSMNIPSGMQGGFQGNPFAVAGGPPQSTPSVAAVTAELGVSDVKSSFNVNNVDKVTKPTSSKDISRLGAIGTQFTEPVSTHNPMAVTSPIKKNFKSYNQNPVLSFMRGELGRNVPLNNDAIAVQNGFAGRHLNVVS